MEDTLNFKLEVEEVSGCKRKLHGEIPAQAATAEYDALVRKYSKIVRLPGFRPGRVPTGIVKNRFKNELREEVTQELVRRAFQQITEEQGLKAVGPPQVESLQYELGGPIRFVVTLEVLPEFEVSDYQGLTYKPEPIVVTDVEVDEALARVRENSATLQPVEGRSAQDGDAVHIDLEGTYRLEPGHDHPHAPFQQKDLVVAIGDKNTHPAFTENLRGSSVGDSRMFEVDYPADYPEKKIAGHKMQYSVQVKEIKYKSLPELNDEFARDVGEFQTLEELRGKIRQDLQAAAEKNQREANQLLLLDQLLARVRVDVPDALVQAQIDKKLESVAYNMAHRGINPARANIDWSKVRSDLAPDAIHAVKGQMVLDKVARNESLEPSAEEVDQELEGLARISKQPVEKIRQYFLQNGRIETLRADLRRRKALQWLYSNAKPE